MTRTRTLTRWLGIHPGEERVAYTLFFYLFAIIASYLLIKTAPEGLFLSRYSVLKLPYVVMGMAGTTGMFLWAYLHLLRRFLLPRITLLVLAFFISNLGVFWLLEGPECQGRRKTRPEGRRENRPLPVREGVDLLDRAGVAGAEACASVQAARLGRSGRHPSPIVATCGEG